MSTDLDLSDVFRTILTFREELDGLVSSIGKNSGPSSGGHADQADFIALAARMAPLSKAQLLQDLWALYELKLKRGGYFVEVGAGDGVKFSNTFLLESLFEWQGALAEPARVWADKLRANRNCYVTDKCIYKENGVMVAFNEVSVAELSTIDMFSSCDDHARTRQIGKRYDVETISLKSFLISAGAPNKIDYMSIDTQGSELDIISSFDFSEYDIKLISIEHNHTARRREIYDILISNGYQRKFEAFSAFDDWYVKM